MLLLWNKRNEANYIRNMGKIQIQVTYLFFMIQINGTPFNENHVNTVYLQQQQIRKIMSFFVLQNIANKSKPKTFT